MCRSKNKIFTSGNNGRVCTNLEGRAFPVIFLIPGNLDENEKTDQEDNNNSKQDEEDLFDHSWIFFGLSGSSKVAANVVKLFTISLGCRTMMILDFGF